MLALKKIFPESYRKQSIIPAVKNPTSSSKSFSAAWKGNGDIEYN